MTKRILGLALVGLLSFSSFGWIQVLKPTTVQCGGEDGKKKKSGKKKNCKSKETKAAKEEVK